jgi:hypothetical protein
MKPGFGDNLPLIGTDLTAGNIPSEPMAAACPDECGASVSGD